MSTKQQESQEVSPMSKEASSGEVVEEFDGPGAVDETTEDKSMSVADVMGPSGDGDSTQVEQDVDDESDEPSVLMDADDEQDTVSIGQDEITDPAEIDWEALWEEFGFDSEDAIGSIVVSQTQLIAAIECTEQEFGGDPHAAKDYGIEQGIVRESRTQEGHLRGYMLEGMLS